MAKKVRDLIGGWWCHGCGRPVELRISDNARGRAYYQCDGHMIGAAEFCNVSHRMSPAESQGLKALAKREGWIGPMPHHYDPPETENNFFSNYKGKLDELRKKFGVSNSARVRWSFEIIEGGPAELERTELEPAPTPARAPEPIEPKLEPIGNDSRAPAPPTRRGFFKRG